MTLRWNERGFSLWYMRVLRNEMQDAMRTEAHTETVDKLRDITFGPRVAVEPRRIRRVFLR
jgi:hypothetical protein